MAELSLSMRDVTQDLTLRVSITGRRRFAVRVWVATRLLGVVAAVLGTKLSVTAHLGD